MREIFSILMKIQSLNLIVKALRDFKMIYLISNKIKKDEKIDWNNRITKIVENHLNALISLNECTKINNLKEQYSLFLERFKSIENNKIDYLNNFFDNNKDVLKFLIVHSLSIKEMNINNIDWFKIYMIKKLRLSKSELLNLYNVKAIPLELMNKLKIFNPKQLGFDKYPIKVLYGFDNYIDSVFINEFGDEISYQRRLDPIVVEYELWNFPVLKKINVSEYINKFETIECSTNFEEGDVPF
jgi:hypothetical protein